MCHRAPTADRGEHRSHHSLRVALWSREGNLYAHTEKLTTSILMRAARREHHVQCVWKGHASLPRSSRGFLARPKNTSVCESVKLPRRHYFASRSLVFQTHAESTGTSFDTTILVRVARQQPEYHHGFRVAVLQSNVYDEDTLDAINNLRTASGI